MAGSSPIFSAHLCDTRRHSLCTSDLRTIQQFPDEEESAYTARINEVAYRCGNIQLEYEKRTCFVDRLQPKLRTTVALYREDQPRHEMTLEHLVHHAQD